MSRLNRFELGLVKLRSLCVSRRGRISRIGMQGNRLQIEKLEKRQLLAAEIGRLERPFPDGLGHADPEVRALIAAITTTNSSAPAYVDSAGMTPDGGTSPNSGQSSGIIRLTNFRNDARFSGIDGSGFSAVVLDTGVDLDHPFFGPDSDSNGVADRIVYSFDFADDDADATDVGGHGSNVTSIVASQDGTHTGMAPASDIIHLKVFENSGAGNFGYIESALQWVVANANTYNVASINMSLGDTLNHNSPQTLYGVADEIAALVAMDVIVVSSSGNSFFGFGSAQGVGYPAADPNSLSVGAVYDANIGSQSYSGGASATTTGARRIAPFSQRSETMTDIMAPGASITGANQSGSTVSMHGTSQASPHIAGIAVLAQELADQVLGRRLTQAEYISLLRDTAQTINDGDDEDDNVANTALDFPLVDVFALGEAILAMADNGDGPTAVAAVDDIQVRTTNSQTIVVTYSDDVAVDVSDFDDLDIRVTGPNGYDQLATFVQVDNNTDGTPRIATYTVPAPNFVWDNSANGNYVVAVEANQVSDTDDNFANAGNIGSFVVDISETLGPDAFNYVAYNTEYVFEDISSTGTLVLNGADDAATSIAEGTGFSFDFYGTLYDQVFVGSNGLIAFVDDAIVTSDYQNSDLTTSPLIPVFAPLWDDFAAPTGLGVFWEVLGSGSSQRLVIQWETNFYGESDLISFQAVLDESDMSLTASYRDLAGGNTGLNEGASATVGIKDGGEQSGTETSRRLVASYNESDNVYIGTGKTLKFTLGNSAPTDISLSQDSIFENLPAGVTIGYFSATDPNYGDTHTYSFVSGDGDTDNASFEIVGSELRSGAAFDFETQSTYSIRVQATDAQGGIHSKAFQINVNDYPEVDSIQVADGTNQRSRVDELVITFDGEVAIASNAFEVVKRGTGGGVVDTAFTTTLDGQGRTVATVTFSGAFARGNGGLVDGNYELTIIAARVTRNGIAMDGDQNGFMGGNRTFGTVEADKFYAFYGDVNGDRNVNFPDFIAFRSAFDTVSGDANFNAILDEDGDGRVNFRDFISFRSRFGTSLGFE